MSTVSIFPYNDEGHHGLYPWLLDNPYCFLINEIMTVMKTIWSYHIYFGKGSCHSQKVLNPNAVNIYS